MQNKKTIALVMVVKNEEKGLKKAVDSCRPFVDEVHISVDNSSNDNTWEIAKECADQVKSFFWCDDFAQARNEAMAHVETDWILFIDGHEYIEKCERLQEALNLDCDVLITPIRMENGIEFSAPRIFKNGLKFVGAVHESVKGQKKAVYEYFMIVHDRLNGQKKESAEIRDIQRQDQIPRIMGAKLKANSRDLHSAFHLMLHSQSKNDHKKALFYSKCYLKYGKSPEELWYVYYVRSLCFLALGKRFRAYLAICRADTYCPKRWETEKIKGIVLFDSQKFEKAVSCLVESFNQNEKRYIYQPLPRDDAGTWNLIGEAFYNRGVLDKASIAFQNASDNTKDKKQKEFFAKRAKLLLQIINGR